MSLLPEIEGELLRVARLPLPDGAPLAPPAAGRSGPAGPRPWRSGAGRRRPFAGAVLAIVAAAASVGLGALALVTFRGANSGHAASGPGSLFPGAPHTQPGSWHLGGMVCPLASRNRYLPKRAGCVSVARGDVDGDGRQDLILLYGRLSRQRMSGGFVPTGYTLEVVRASGGVLTAHVPQPLEPPTLLMIGNDNRLPGEDVWVHETHISSGELTGVYAFDGHRLRRAGGFWFGGDSGVQFGFACSLRRATITQQQFLFEGPGINGRWQRTETTYRWVGARLVKSGQRHSTWHGIPPVSGHGLGTRCGRLLEPWPLHRL
jgi:hypothetical protein